MPLFEACQSEVDAAATQSGHRACNSHLVSLPPTIVVVVALVSGWLISSSSGNEWHQLKHAYCDGEHEERKGIMCIK